MAWPLIQYASHAASHAHCRTLGMGEKPNRFAHQDDCSPHDGPQCHHPVPGQICTRHSAVSVSSCHVAGSDGGSAISPCPLLVMHLLCAPSSGLPLLPALVCDRGADVIHSCRRDSLLCMDALSLAHSVFQRHVKCRKVRDKTG